MNVCIINVWGYTEILPQSQQGGLQARLISVASANVPVLAVPPVVFAFPSTLPLELLGLHFVPFASPICHGLN